MSERPIPTAASAQSTSSPLDQIADWPVDHATGGVTSPTATLATHGDPTWRVRIASITKALVAYAGLVALEEGSIALDQPAGPPGSTIRHLLAHASGLPFNGTVPIAPPGRRRVYSNTGIEAFAEELAKATGMTMAEYLHEAVLVPLGMSTTELRTSPAWGAWSDVDDLLRFCRELLEPSLVAPETLAAAVSEQFPGLAGVVPGMGRYSRNSWGLGFEIKATKDPHWTAPNGSPRTFGHFGGSGTFLWVDPAARLGCVVLTNREFGDWAPPLWSALSQDVLETWG